MARALSRGNKISKLKNLGRRIKGWANWMEMRWVDIPDSNRASCKHQQVTLGLTKSNCSIAVWKLKSNSNQSQNLRNWTQIWIICQIISTNPATSDKSSSKFKKAIAEVVKSVHQIRQRYLWIPVVQIPEIIKIENCIQVSVPIQTSNFIRTLKASSRYRSNNQFNFTQTTFQINWAEIFSNFNNLTLKVKNKPKSTNHSKGTMIARRSTSLWITIQIQERASMEQISLKTIQK